MADAPQPSPDLPRPPPLSWSGLFAARRDVRVHRAALVGGSVLAIAAGALAVHLLVRAPAPPATESLLPYAGSSPAGAPPTGPAAAAVATTSTTPSELVVHAAGAVAAPGVHRLPSGSRVADLLAAAGGAMPDAELDRVNLAAPLVDGAQVWFPRVGEPAPPPVEAGSTPASGSGGGSTSEGGPVDLNTATPEELDTLPGVGPATAAAIIEHREQHGPFRSVEELLDVPGIGDAKLAQLRDLVRV